MTCIIICFFGLPPPAILDQGSWNLTLTFHCLEAWCQDNVWWCELSAIILLLGIIPFSTLSLNSKKKGRTDQNCPQLPHFLIISYGKMAIKCGPFSAHHSAVCRFFETAPLSWATSRSKRRGKHSWPWPQQKHVGKTVMLAVNPYEPPLKQPRFRWRSSGQESQKKIVPLFEGFLSRMPFFGGDLCL